MEKELQIEGGEDGEISDNIPIKKPFLPKVPEI